MKKRILLICSVILSLSNVYSQPYRLETGLWRGVATEYEKGVMLVKVHQDNLRN